MQIRNRHSSSPFPTLQTQPPCGTRWLLLVKPLALYVPQGASNTIRCTGGLSIPVKSSWILSRLFLQSRIMDLNLPSQPSLETRRTPLAKDSFPLRIALTSFHQGWGGQPYQILLLAEAMKDLGHEVVILTPPGSDLAQRAKKEGIAVFEGCRFSRGFRPWAIVRDLFHLKQFLSSFQPSVLHCHGSQDSWLVAIARALFCSRRIPSRDRPSSPRPAFFPIIRTKHNSYPVRRHAANRWLYGKAMTRVIAVAEVIRQDLLQLGVATSRHVVTIHAGLPDSFGEDVPPDARNSVRREFALLPDTPLVGLVGRLAPDKGQEILLRALPRVQHTIPHIHALFIGTGGDYDRQLGLRKTLRLEEVAHYLLFRTDIARLTAALDIAILAATACDASSTVLKEAMALGIPVIGTDVGGTAEILADGCGVLIPPGNPEKLADAILHLFAMRGTPELAEQTRRARERVNREFRMRIVAERTEAIYREALEEAMFFSCHEKGISKGEADRNAQSKT